MPAMLALLLAAQLSAALPTPLTIHVTGVRDDAGVVRVELCSPRTFLRSSCEVIGSAPAVKGETVVTLPEAPTGIWAIQAYHDRNGNQTVDRGVLGVPLEEIGFSREAPVGFKGPTFNRAAFPHEEPESVTVRLKRYW